MEKEFQDRIFSIEDTVSNSLDRMAEEFNVNPDAIVNLLLIEGLKQHGFFTDEGEAQILPFEKVEPSNVINLDEYRAK